MQFTDAVTIAGTRRTGDGYLVAEARAVRTGIQIYLGDEVGKPDMQVVRVYRPADQVFSAESLQSFTHAPITINHPKDQVSAANWKDLAVGEVSTMAKKDGEWVSLPLILKDAKGIEQVESGKRELSAGYTCDLDWTPGTTEDGQQFDATQKNIKINHLAIVDSARAGSKARIGDSAISWGASPVTPQIADERTSPMDLRNILVDGLSVSTTDQGAQAITKLQSDLQSSAAKFTDAQTAHAKVVADHATAIAAKDEEIGTLKADLKKAQDAAPKAADLDKLVADRAALVTTIKAIDAKIEVSGKSDADLRREAVKSKLGDEMVKDASDAEISGMFKAIAKDVKTLDPFAAVFSGGLKQTVGDAATQANDALHASVSDLNAWRKEA